MRDGSNGEQWHDNCAFQTAAEVRADMAGPDAGLAITPNTRFKYSNHAYALAGMVIEAVTGEAYGDWMKREVISASDLEETLCDAPIPRGTLFARGHTGKTLLGRRMVIPGDNPALALAPGAGFVSTAADMARFFASLSPGARRSILRVESRREMARRLWRDPYSNVERWYGLGLIASAHADWEWFGHSGRFQGYITHSLVVPAQALSVTVLTNATDGLSPVWLDGTLHILRALKHHGAASPRTDAWRGRWWSLWGAMDLLPARHRVLIANPALVYPLQDASEIEVQTPVRASNDHGQVVQAGGYANYGEPVRLERDAQGRAMALWLGSSKFQPEADAARDLSGRYAQEALITAK